MKPAHQRGMVSALLQHPEANAVKSPYTSATLLGIAPAVVQSGRANKLYVIPGSHACRSGMLMLEHKGVPYRRVPLSLAGCHPDALRHRGSSGIRFALDRADGWSGDHTVPSTLI